MFDPTDQPRLFFEPCGVDFARAVVDGLCRRLQGQPPEAMARVLLLVNTAQMRRQITRAFQSDGARFLPRIRLIADLRAETLIDPLPDVTGDLANRLSLVRIVQELADTGAPFVPALPVFDLADSLSALLGEMAAEGVPPEALDAIDVRDESGHWQQALSFLRIVQEYRATADMPPGAEAWQRMAVEALIARWRATPPDTPVIVAGSTGSRGATTLLMQAVARLPQGALILPGFDDAMPAPAWADLSDAMTGEDHPQFRYARLIASLGGQPADLTRWSDATPPAPARNATLSLALRPAPVTDCWLREGPSLPPLEDAFAGVTLLEAAQRREEAMAIALRLRAAATDGQSAALITPDRLLAREVTTELDRWSITPDDSAGVPLHLTPPGRFLLHVASLFQRKPGNSQLLELLKHPLCNSGPAPGQHKLLTRDLELWLRRKGIAEPTPDILLRWAEQDKRPAAEPWADWVGRTILADLPFEGALSEMAAAVHQLATDIAAGPGAEPGATGGLWDRKAGKQTHAVLDQLIAEAGAVDRIDAVETFALMHRLLSAQQLRDIEEVNPLVMILGPQEVRARHAEVMILAGLNEGTWPEQPPPDPWLNRQMRHQAGLLLPERRIGLSAHDFQQAAAAPEVWLTRARRSDDAETVPSRWMNRLTNLLNGLPENGGPAALDAMRSRGNHWLAQARQMDRATEERREPRPSPQPPIADRPKELPVTQIARLIRDPYAIYARYILGLKPLNPLDRVPDALLRGIVVHKALESYLRALDTGTTTLDRTAFLHHVRDRIDALVPWPSARALWLARMQRVADWFIENETHRRAISTTLAHEAEGAATVPGHDFILTGRADRIDRDADGGWLIYDYKTGAPPTPRQQAAFDKQLLLLAAIAEYGQFKDIGSGTAIAATYIGLGAKPVEREAPLADEPPARVWEEFARLVAAFEDENTGYTPRRRVFTDREVSDYDHLSRYGEWDPTDPPIPRRVGHA